jgi:sugar O-acyltransferase (sialic acid O-acetyltransferase NeuD family)
LIERLKYELDVIITNLFFSKRMLSIIGGGGHSRVIAEVAGLSGWIVWGLYDDNEDILFKEVNGFKVLGPIDSLKTSLGIIAIGDNKIRKNVNDRLTKVVWAKVIHPSAIISADVEIGEGTVIMAGAVIQPGVKIGKHCIINTASCIDHDCIINDYVHIAPNASLAGGISVGEGTLIGIGSSIIPNIKIGQWSKIGAGSVVVHNQPSNCTIVGSPAKPLKFNNEQK